MGRENDAVFAHVSQSLGDRSHLDCRGLTPDDRADPELICQICSLCKGKLRQEKGKDDKDFPEGDGLQQVSCDCGEPFGAIALLGASYSEVAEEEGLRLLHGGDALLPHSGLAASIVLHPEGEVPIHLSDSPTTV